MTSASLPEYEEYPQYCYHLSPTITKWCPLQACDIKGLRWHPGFEGQDDTFFYLNHPIRWVRVVGLVVAIDSFYGRRVYTIDDSTGAVIECSSVIVLAARPNYEKVDEGGQKAVVAGPALDLYAELDVGMVVEVKGNLKLFRDQKQIKIEKMQRVRSTNQEVQFWDKIRNFKTDVLSKPWVLERKILRRLEKENKTDADSKEKERRRREKKGEAKRNDTGQQSTHSARAYAGSGLKKPYRPSKLSSVTAAEEGQYDALGL